MRKLKLIFVGMPDMALVCLPQLLEKKFDITGVVPPNKNHVTYKGFIEYSKSQNLNIIEFDKNPNEKKCIDKIKELNADLGVVCSYNYLLNKEFLSTTKMGYINCHPSLLPNYRGAMPYFHIIKNGEKQSGITLHFMDESFDTGDIVYQKEFNILPWETMGTLFNRTNYMISDALVEILHNYEKGVDFTRTPQEKSNSYITAPKVEGNLKIRWNRGIDEISNLVRACNPFFNAFTIFRNNMMKILKASPIKQKHDLKPGQIARCDENCFLVAASDGYISIEMLQLSTWGIFNPMEFYYTFSPTTDEFLN